MTCHLAIQSSTLSLGLFKDASITFQPLAPIQSDEFGLDTSSPGSATTEREPHHGGVR